MRKICPTCGGQGDVLVHLGREQAERNLTHLSIYVRDDAVVELLELDDPRSIPAVKAAIATEQSPEMKVDMQQLLDQLAFDGATE